MVRRRGLLRSAGRTAVIAGTATAASGRVAHSQQQKLGTPASRSAPQHAAEHMSGGNDLVGSLKELASMRASGALSEKEYAAAKAKLLAS